MTLTLVIKNWGNLPGLITSFNGTFMHQGISKPLSMNEEEFVLFPNEDRPIRFNITLNVPFDEAIAYQEGKIIYTNLDDSEDYYTSYKRRTHKEFDGKIGTELVYKRAK